MRVIIISACGGWRRLAAAATLVAVLAGLFTLAWWRGTRDDAAALATVAAAVLAVAVLITPWALRRSDASRVPDERLDQLAARLASTVQRQWEREWAWK